MMYTKEFLISEIQRFIRENGRNPKQIEMQRKFGYPSHMAYINHFGTWNKALIESRIEVYSGGLTGFETCDNCGKTKPENQNWRYKNKQRLCINCYRKLSADYMNNNLSPNSDVGFAFMSQRVVAKTLDLDLKYDCNCSQGFNAQHDLYDKKLGYIDVKSATLQKDNAWHFSLTNKYKPDIYIMLAFSNDKSNIEYVWITDVLNNLTFNKSSVSISNSEKGLKRAEPWEVDVEPYNDAYHSMSLENCSVLRSN